MNLYFIYETPGCLLWRLSNEMSQNNVRIANPENTGRAMLVCVYLCVTAAYLHIS